MCERSLKYGIMGGTFDPIHIGHLFIAEEVRTKFKLDKVIFIPTGNPPHKESSNITSSDHRYKMTLLATITNPFFEVSTIEIDKKETTYTIDTIKDLKKEYNGKGQFYFITGADAILGLTEWKKPDELLSMCTFVAATRPGFDISKMQEKIQELEKIYNRSIYTIAVPSLQISSTDIRKRIKDGCNIKYLLPEVVEDYIIKNKLYLNGTK